MNDFSMYEHALRVAPSEAEDLGEVSHVSRRVFEERQTFAFRARAPCLEYLSLLIETAVLLRTNRSGRVYVGFEKLSRMEPVADRYLRIADLSERVYVFGEPDWRPPRHPNLRVIHTARGARLSRELLVVVNSSSLRVALVARGEDDFDAPAPEERRFSAFKTSDPAAVEQLAAAAEELLDSLHAL